MHIQEILSAQKFKLSGELNEVNLVIIGCGGTGSKLIRDLCQAARATLKLVPNLNLQMLFADPDVVEHKNLDRQNFAPFDVGQFKSKVLAERYSQVYGLGIKHTTDIVDTSEGLYSLILGAFGKNPQRSNTRYVNTSFDTVLITCVDNHQTRKLVGEYFLEHAPVYWLDLGNEATNGRINVGYNAVSGYYPDHLNSTGKFDLPCATELFPDILEVAGDIKPSELPCGVGGAQDLNINAKVAVEAISWICSYFRAIVNLKSNLVVRNDKLRDVCNYYGVEFGINPPATNTIFSTPERLSKVNWGSEIRRLRNTNRYRERLHDAA